MRNETQRRIEVIRGRVREIRALLPDKTKDLNMLRTVARAALANETKDVFAEWDKRVMKQEAIVRGLHAEIEALYKAEQYLMITQNGGRRRGADRRRVVSGEAGAYQNGARRRVRAL